ncbi:type I-E CRISPR-associated endonuclease Cas1e [Saccharothrix xinjiangensis]|uniref:CRISPR-associated endonuclease Cas1 n=1 Tax=Saccharothrix xinjiangensis TaxID=204798 RepID=A0ABV9XVF3_9PSEU
MFGPSPPNLIHLVEQVGWPTTHTWDTRDHQPLLDRITVGGQWAFRLRANPVSSRRKSPDSTRSQRFGHVTVAQQTEWLLTRAERHGFSVVVGEHKEPDVAVRGREHVTFKRQGSHVTLSTAVFEGHPEVLDADLLRAALVTGIGPAKGYGCGLLTLSPPSAAPEQPRSRAAPIREVPCPRSSVPDIPGAKPVPLSQLVRAQDRLSFLYLEHCEVSRDDNAITATDKRGTVHIPAATLGALLLGPGTNVTQQAMVLLAESGSTAVWVGEHAVRYYAHGRTLAAPSRLRVARQMYAMRFLGEDTDSLTMQQLRGREGARVRRLYREHAQRTGVQWQRRDYDVSDFDSGTPVNRALSAANTSLYGVVHAVIVALGCAPGLGFVHTGHVKSFVYDIADLYKADITIPIAFDVTAREVADIGTETRRAVRDRMRDGVFFDRCVRDIKTLLREDEGRVEYGPEAFEDPDFDSNVVMLWDDNGRAVAGGTNYDDQDGDF